MCFASASLTVLPTPLYHLRLDSELLEGSSAYCDTFASPPLSSSSSSDFHIHSVELWHL